MLTHSNTQPVQKTQGQSQARFEASLASLERDALYLLDIFIKPSPDRIVRDTPRKIEKLNAILGDRTASQYRDELSVVDGLSFHDLKRLQGLRDAYVLLEALRPQMRGVDASKDAKYQAAVDSDLIPALHKFIRGAHSIQSIITLGKTMPAPFPENGEIQFLSEYLCLVKRLSGMSTIAEIPARYSTLSRMFGPPCKDIVDKASIEWHLVFNEFPFLVFHRHLDGENPKKVARDLKSSDKVTSWHISAHAIFDFQGFSEATKLKLIPYYPSSLRNALADRHAALKEGFLPLGITP